MSIIGLQGKREPWFQQHTLQTVLVLAVPALLVAALMVLGFEIKLVLAGLIAIILLGLMFLYPVITTLVVLFVLYANLPVVAIRSYGVPEPVAASFFVLLGIPVVYYLTVARRPLIINKFFMWMVAYLGVLFLSAAASGNVEGSISRIISYVSEGMLLYILILNTVRTPNLVRNSVWALILAGVLMGSISLYQELTGSYDNDFGGFAVVKETGVVDTGQVNLLGQEEKRLRLSGPLGSKNRYAQVMVVLLPLALMRVWGERNKLLRLAAALSCLPIVGGALLTFSRGAGLSLILTLFAMAFFRLLKLHHLVIIALVGVLFVSTVIPDYIYRISTAAEVAELATGDADEAGGSVRGRATVNLAALNIFLDYPLLGVGPGQTSRYMIDYGNEIGFRRLETNRRAHNMYLEELADTGILGFSFFMSILGLTLHGLFQQRRRWMQSHPEIGYLFAGLILAIVAYMSTAIFLHLSYMRYYWVILALAGAAIEVYRQEMPESAPLTLSSTPISRGIGRL